LMFMFLVALLDLKPWFKDACCCKRKSKGWRLD